MGKNKNVRPSIQRLKGQLARRLKAQKKNKNNVDESSEGKKRPGTMGDSESQNEISVTKKPRLANSNETLSSSVKNDSAEESEAEDALIHENSEVENHDSPKETVHRVLENEAASHETDSKDTDVECISSQGEDDEEPKLTVRKSGRKRRAMAKAAAAKSKAAELKPTVPVNSEEIRKDTTEETPPPEETIEPGALLKDYSEVDERDVMLKKTYAGLDPLPKYSSAVKLTGSGLCGMTISISNWVKDKNATINKQWVVFFNRFVLQAITFKSFGDAINLSRFSPTLVQAKTSPKQRNTIFAVEDGGQWRTALCFSVMVCTSSNLGRPILAQTGAPRKEIAGYFLSQEFERFAGAAGVICGETELWSSMYNSAFKFSTLSGTVNSGITEPRAPRPSATPTKTGGMFSAATSPIAVQNVQRRSVLAHDAVVPIYDYREEKVFDPAIHTNPTSRFRPISSHLDVPVDSLMLVAYTMSRYNRDAGNPSTAVGGNIMWVAVLGLPENATLPGDNSLFKSFKASSQGGSPSKSKGKAKA
ncbi:hypothetical protein BJ138DRAFT_1103794 [Hygrophoropsis aurantiaca]|uniref:Uncharacterized protein n=1 Tax=Hygrophoropsis aurantiaca TaxID=72124 RepID=A0ACB8A4X2_9AGAM|nr:hypothetical protein BJ138DRAFT_1103794 [Hygrophoropsis aurantiaca]